MMLRDILALLRGWQEDAHERHAEARKRHEADAPDRALRLCPEIVVRWTDVVRDAAAAVEPGTRPCDYGPWIKALREAGSLHGFLAHPADLVPETSIASRFRNFMEDVSTPAWPEPRRDLIEFALAVLEADVMLFRSGYAKRHLLKRLKQAPLTAADIARLEAMLKRSVLEGTGLEEYRAWGKLAAHLVAQGRLPDLVEWLARPDLGKAIAARKLVDTPDERVMRNASRMLDHIVQRNSEVLHAPERSL